jgi:hypothetical protein
VLLVLRKFWQPFHHQGSSDEIVFFYTALVAKCKFKKPVAIEKASAKYKSRG